MTRQTQAKGDPPRPTGPNSADPVQSSELEHRSTAGVAHAAPPGLAAVALTTFLLSAFNAGWTSGTTAWLSFGIAAGGLVQLLAGMWEFRDRSVFGSTAFSTYGAFWVIKGILGRDALSVGHPWRLGVNRQRATRVPATSTR